MTGLYGLLVRACGQSISTAYSEIAVYAALFLTIFVGGYLGGVNFIVQLSTTGHQEACVYHVSISNICMSAQQGE